MVHRVHEVLPDVTTLHLVSLPHTETTDDFSWCAFTALAKSMSTMMSRYGYEVILYAGENNEAECSEHVVCSDSPPHSRPTIPEWTGEYFRPMNKRVIAALEERLEPHDIILLSMGCCQTDIMAAFPSHLAVEYAVGYSGVAALYRVFPSYAWMHMVYGWQCGNGNPQAIQGRFYDAVIPHFLDADQFPLGEGGNYLLFVGRLNEDKGVGIAVDLSKRTGLPLKIVGAGTLPEYGEYLGVVGPTERAELMGGALAVVAPSLYCEPFCLVAAEAQMVGTPAITTDFGAFTETVEHGVTGFRCRTMSEFEDAVRSAPNLDRMRIRSRAMIRFSTRAVAPQYDEYFDRLGGLWDKGWYG